MRLFIFILALIMSFNINAKDKHTVKKIDIPNNMYIPSSEPCYFSTYKLKPNWVFYRSPYGGEGFIDPGCLPANYCDYDCRINLKRIIGK